MFPQVLIFKSRSTDFMAFSLKPDGSNLPTSPPKHLGDLQAKSPLTKWHSTRWDWTASSRSRNWNGADSISRDHSGPGTDRKPWARQHLQFSGDFPVNAAHSQRLIVTLWF
jgi:hypothetical protein